MSTPPIQKPLPAFSPQTPKISSSGFRNPQEAVVALVIIGVGLALLLFTLLSM